MVTRFLLIFFSLLVLNSCWCDSFVTSDGGIRSKILYKKYYKKRINPETVNIKTSLIYKFINFKYEESAQKYSKIKDFGKHNSEAYLIFYKNGNYYRQINPLDKKLSKEVFNTKKGDLSFIIKRNKKVCLVDYSLTNCGSYQKKEFKVSGDTLMISAGSNKGYRIWYYYLKKEVPLDWLDWESDI